MLKQIALDGQIQVLSFLSGKSKLTVYNYLYLYLALLVYLPLSSFSFVHPTKYHTCCIYFSIELNKS